MGREFWSVRSLLGVDKSAVQRDRLIADMAQLQSSYEAATGFTSQEHAR